MSITHRGIIAVQSNINHHIMLFTENGERVMHIPCDKEKTEIELKSVIDNYYLLTENFEKIYEDDENEIPT